MAQEQILEIIERSEAGTTAKRLAQELKLQICTVCHSLVKIREYKEARFEFLGFKKGYVYYPKRGGRTKNDHGNKERQG